MDAGVITGSLAAAVAIATAYLTYRQAIKNQRVQEAMQTKKVDAEAYDRAQRIYQASLDEFERRLKRMDDELSNERQENQVLRREVNSLREYISALRKYMIEAGLIPPPPEREING